ncbi:hypothetical protein CVT26_007094 [Gymnopilus dilepis]|uniref:F-box domain-containing protein n=1 Tax=Gymnopilus dilepis TaxID=231916 RepID=A0A409VNP9_9AGAR|nr:hypothetical protein CVT26_007094 [Gymnopilus dilepis]
MTQAANPLNISEIPVEVLLDNLLPCLPVHDILSLACCSKVCFLICASSTMPGVPYPMQVPLEGIRVVNLVAGGMSFHALDSEGRVHVWGTSFSHATTHVPNVHWSYHPHIGQLTTDDSHADFKISCGRVHSSFLDSANKIWTCTNWGRPFRLSSPIFNEPDYAPKQIECGWMFSSLLTKSGDVFVWWPFAGSMGDAIQEKMQEMDGDGDTKAYATKDNVIPCITWDLDVMPTRLPSIPPLPDLVNTGDIKKADPTQLIQIAGFDNHIVGLTNNGHVLKYGSLHDETGVPRGRWEYLPQFSEVERVREQATFSDESDAAKLEPPETMKITHLSANFLHFVAYSTGQSSIVLVGDTDTNPESQPKIIRELQNKSVISVVIGDYHNAALTANGKLLTWGAYSNGALGLGDPFELEPGAPGGFASSEDRVAARRHWRTPPSVQVPTEVRFDHNLKKPKDRFCFATTAAGWHTGALVIDLESNEDEGEMEQAGLINNAQHHPGPSQGQWATPPIIPLPGILRFGHAARALAAVGIRIFLFCLHFRLECSSTVSFSPASAVQLIILTSFARKTLGASLQAPGHTPWEGVQDASAKDWKPEGSMFPPGCLSSRLSRLRRPSAQSSTTASSHTNESRGLDLLDVEMDNTSLDKPPVRIIDSRTLGLPSLVVSNSEFTFPLTLESSHSLSSSLASRRGKNAPAPILVPTNRRTKELPYPTIPSAFLGSPSQHLPHFGFVDGDSKPTLAFEEMITNLRLQCLTMALQTPSDFSFNSRSCLGLNSEPPESSAEGKIESDDLDFAVPLCDNPDFSSTLSTSEVQNPDHVARRQSRAKGMLDSSQEKKADTLRRSICDQKASDALVRPVTLPGDRGLDAGVIRNPTSPPVLRSAMMTGRQTPRRTPLKNVRFVLTHEDIAKSGQDKLTLSNHCQLSDGHLAAPASLSLTRKQSSLRSTWRKARAVAVSFPSRASTLAETTHQDPTPTQASPGRHSLSRIIKGPLFSTAKDERAFLSVNRSDRSFDEKAAARENVVQEKKSRLPIPLRNILIHFK